MVINIHFYYITYKIENWNKKKRFNIIVQILNFSKTCMTFLSYSITIEKQLK